MDRGKLQIEQGIKLSGRQTWSNHCWWLLTVLDVKELGRLDVYSKQTGLHQLVGHMHNLTMLFSARECSLEVNVFCFKNCSEDAEVWGIDVSATLWGRNVVDKGHLWFCRGYNCSQLRWGRSVRPAGTGRLILSWQPHQHIEQNIRARVAEDLG